MMLWVRMVLSWNISVLLKFWHFFRCISISITEIWNIDCRNKIFAHFRLRSCEQWDSSMLSNVCKVIQFQMWINCCMYFDFNCNKLNWCILILDLLIFIPIPNWHNSDNSTALHQYMTRKLRTLVDEYISYFYVDHKDAGTPVKLFLFIYPLWEMQEAVEFQALYGGDWLILLLIFYLKLHLSFVQPCLLCSQLMDGMNCDELGSFLSQKFKFNQEVLSKFLGM